MPKEGLPGPSPPPGCRVALLSAALNPGAARHFRGQKDEEFSTTAAVGSRSRARRLGNHRWFNGRPAQAADKIKYIALGDSYAAGQGAGAYQDACYRSDNSYSELAAEDKAVKLVVNAACSGKTTWDVVNTQLRQLNKSTELVTITAGGNNIGFGDIINYCGVVLAQLPPAPKCGGALEQSEYSFRAAS
ncbi:GDSL-type esterase/lipase family protein [Arthrobacter sp. SAFR-044]|uniref:GDSL-type esterase/lipase family protein n=1 Tax=Arthrobacter sp. SAFR-044 TaxID=3387278 RepID=UPI003F7CCBDB